MFEKAVILFPEKEVNSEVTPRQVQNRGDETCRACLSRIKNERPKKIKLEFQANYLARDPLHQVLCSTYVEQSTSDEQCRYPTRVDEQRLSSTLTGRSRYPKAALQRMHMNSTTERSALS